MGVVAQRLEERRVVSLLDALQDAEVEFEQSLAGMEDPTEVMAEPPGNVLERHLGHEVQIQLGPQPGHPSSEHLGSLVGRTVHHVVVAAVLDEGAQLGQIVPRVMDEPPADHAGLQVEVQQHRHRPRLRSSGRRRLVDERVVGPAQAPQLFAQGTFLRTGHVIDDQHFEVGSGLPVVLMAQYVGAAERFTVEVLGGPLSAVAIGVRDQRAVDPGDEPGEAVVLSRSEQPPPVLECLHPGKRPVDLDRRQHVEQVGHTR